MDISVIIPTHNRAHLLERALRSVLAQTLAPREVIVVDDGSDDHTRKLVTENFPDCHYLFQSNRGVSSARNQGIAAAAGEWLAFLDSDDEWLPGKLKAQREALKQAPDRRICHTEEIWIRHDRRVQPMKKHAKSGGRIFLQCLPLCVISPSSVLIHRSLFDEVGTFDETLPACEDYDLWLRICARHPVVFVPEPQIVKYGGHPDQLSRRHWGMDRFRVRALAGILAWEGLPREYRTATEKTLRQKAEILAQGAHKRGRQSEAEEYRALAQRYAARPAE
jgi:glycosyltransferase involved in cell wall biosynthesis